ncbi:hypothetical protein ACSFA0_25520 [Variovorax sp. LT1P1]|uniref:hypothetical protein n=1 Tax=Variovorax sp. LT1P1 TaxID=3443730 RepID=UPI003F4683B7
MTGALKSGGLSAALKVLNARVAPRRPAVYRLAPDGHLVNVALVGSSARFCPSYLLSIPST